MNYKTLAGGELVTIRKETQCYGNWVELTEVTEESLKQAKPIVEQMILRTANQLVQAGKHTLEEMTFYFLQDGAKFGGLISVPFPAGANIVHIE